MRVDLLPCPLPSGAFYRLLEPMRVLQSQGRNVRVPSTLGGVPYLEGDVVVFQRPANLLLVDWMRACQRDGRAVVVEIDDDVLNIPLDNKAVGGPEHKQAFVAALRVADLVTVTTPKLVEVFAQAAGHRRFAVLPNCVPASYLDIVPKKDHETVQVGWTGSVETHWGDLLAVGNAVRQVLDDTGADFRVVGSGVGVRQLLGLEKPLQATVNWKGDPDGDQTERSAPGWLPLHLYPHAMATIDVGIVPLARIGFNDGKSFLKGLEFASLGVPFVATPTGPYRELHRLGAGLLADRQKDWRKHLTALIRDPDYRAEVAARGRQVAAELTYENQADRWWEAWGAAALNRARVAA